MQDTLRGSEERVRLSSSVLRWVSDSLVAMWRVTPSWVYADNWLGPRGFVKKGGGEAMGYIRALILVGFTHRVGGDEGYIPEPKPQCVGAISVTGFRCLEALKKVLDFLRQPTACPPGQHKETSLAQAMAAG
jgi:hypothetical protein